MLICRVVGTVVSTIKDEKLTGRKLLIVREATVENELVGKPLAAVDTVDAGVGDLVLIAQGSSARQTNVTKKPLAVDGVSPSNDLAPSWNCEWIAFQTDRDGNWEIYKTDPGGANQIRLTNHAAMDQAPVWSPDGRWIAFQSNRDGNWELYVMDSNGGNVRRITDHPAADRNPSWSWDGKWLAFDSDREGQVDVFKINLDTLQTIRLTESLGRDSDPAWVPYCDWIFFQSDRDDNYEVYRMDYEGMVEQNISRQPDWMDALDIVPGFSPATSYIPEEPGNSIFLAVVIVAR